MFISVCERRDQLHDYLRGKEIEALIYYGKALHQHTAFLKKSFEPFISTGNGVFAGKDFEPGDFLVEYRGKMVYSYVFVSKLYKGPELCCFEYMRMQNLIYIALTPIF